MVDEKEKAQRRVYILPKELVDRIVSYQSKMGMQSEVEAARRLLDEALKQRESAEDIIRRFTRMMRDTKILSDVAKEVLVGHPKVNQIKFEGPNVKAYTTDSDEITFYGFGGGRLKQGSSDPMTFDDNGDIDGIPF